MMSTVTLVDLNRDCRKDLLICGTQCDDSVTVFDDAKNKKTTVWDDKDGNGCIDDCEITEYCQSFGTIKLDMKGGDDKVDYVLVSDLCGAKRNITALLGCGDDCFTFESGCGPKEDSEEELPSQLNSEEEEEGKGGADITNCSDLCLNVQGQEGNDHLNVDLSKTSIKKSKVSVVASGGSGNDCVIVSTPDGKDECGILDRSTVKVAVDLGAGCNTMKLSNGSNIDNSSVDISVKGGASRDTFQHCEASNLTGCASLKVSADLGRGNDVYCGTFDFGSCGINVDCTAKATFDIKGGDGCDDLSAKAKGGHGNGEEEEPEFPTLQTEEEEGEEEEREHGKRGINGLFGLSLNGGYGNDKVSIDLSCAVLNVKGTLKLAGIGGCGNDCVEVVAHVSECSSGCYDVLASGGAGSDKVALGFQDDSCGCGSHAKLVLDGGSGCDEYDVEGNRDVCVRNAEKLCEGLLPEFCDKEIEEDVLA